MDYFCSPPWDFNVKQFERFLLSLHLGNILLRMEKVPEGIIRV
jgi:hypothetical protein